MATEKFVKVFKCGVKFVGLDGKIEYNKRDIVTGGKRMYSITKKIAMSNTGADGKMDLVSLLESFGDCEQFQIDNMQGVMESLKNDSHGIYVIARQVDIESLPSYGDEITVTTYVYNLSKTVGTRNTFVYDASGNILVRSYATGVFVDTTTQKMIRVPEKYWEVFSADDKQDMEYLPRRIILPKVDGETKGEFVVPDCFIDSYLHMNNVNYVMLALMNISNGNKIKRIRVEYKNPAKASEIIVPVVREQDDIITVSLNAKDGTQYANVEFTLAWKKTN